MTKKSALGVALLSAIAFLCADACGSSRAIFGGYSDKTDETADPACRICTARRIPTDAGVDDAAASDAKP